MTHHPSPGARSQTAGWMPSQTQFWGDPMHSILMHLGQLLERSEHQAEQLSRIENRLEKGQDQFESHDNRISRLERKVCREPNRSQRERLFKIGGIILLPLLSLLDARLFEAALKLVEIWK